VPLPPPSSAFLQVNDGVLEISFMRNDGIEIQISTGGGPMSAIIPQIKGDEHHQVLLQTIACEESAGSYYIKLGDIREAGIDYSRFVEEEVF